MLGSATRVCRVPFISRCQAGCAVKPALKWGSPVCNELWSTAWLQSYFPFVRFSAQVFFLMCTLCSRDCKRYFLPGSHSTREPFNPPLYSKQLITSSPMSGSDAGFKPYTVLVQPMPEDTPGMLSALLWNAGSCGWNRWLCWVPVLLLTSKRDLISLSQIASLTPRRQIPFLVSISPETQEPNL